MDKIISIIASCAPVFLALIMGMFCRTKGFVSREGVDTLKKVVINLTLPFVLFNSFATAEYSLSVMAQPVAMFLVCTLLLALGYAFVRISHMNSQLAPFVSTGFEAGMLGIPLFGLLFPNESLSRLAILILGHEIFIFTLYKSLLTRKTSLKAIINDFTHSPILIAVVLGLVFGATGLYGKLQDWGLAVIVDSVTSFISAPTATIILLTIGYDLAPREIPWRRTGGLIAMRVVMMALFAGIMLLLNRTVLHGMIFEGAILLLAILPPPFIIPVFADEPSERVQISATLSAYTLITMVMFAVYTVIFAIT